jgi:hypothetical protein
VNYRTSVRSRTRDQKITNSGDNYVSDQRERFTDRRVRSLCRPPRRNRSERSQHPPGWDRFCSCEDFAAVPVRLELFWLCDVRWQCFLYCPEAPPWPRRIPPRWGRFLLRLRPALPPHAVQILPASSPIDGVEDDCQHDRTSLLIEGVDSRDSFQAGRLDRTSNSSGIARSRKGRCKDRPLHVGASR